VPIKGSLWMTRRTGSAPGRPGCAARLRLPDRRHAGRRRGDADLPVLFHRKKLCKYKGEFGKGAIEGVAGPEAANNASAAGTLVPLLTLGLPTSATAAIMLAGFQQYGLNPGPLLFAEQARPGLGPDRQPVHRQRHAGDPQPAADRAC
jgi:putative tricarboxylic transport membrane protein